MNRWEHDIKTVSRDEIVEYCTLDGEWQIFRESLKGLSTDEKLKQLDGWKRLRKVLGVDERRTQVQIDNYINALKRGGQLDLEGNVVR